MAVWQEPARSGGEAELGLNVDHWLAAACWPLDALPPLLWYVTPEVRLASFGRVVLLFFFTPTALVTPPPARS